MEKMLPLHEERFTSPPSSLPLYELKMLQKYIHGLNLKSLGESLPNAKKYLMLRQFFKHRRFQEVEIKTLSGQVYRGKVRVIGRDFVAISTLLSKQWFPYTAIESAAIPFGIPDIPNTHQHLVYDEEQRKMLVTDFGRIVGKREELKNQFFEESLLRNLQDWQHTSLEICCKGDIKRGKLIELKKKSIILAHSKQQSEVPLAQIEYIRHSRWLSLLPTMFKRKRAWRSE